MKKVLFALTLIFASFAIVSCSDDDKDDDKHIEYADVPKEAKDFLNRHFAAGEGTQLDETTIQYVKHDKDGTYDVVFKNRMEIEFYSNGIWKDIDLNGNTLPESVAFLIPTKALSYISTKYPNKEIEEIEKKGPQSETQDFEIELRGDIDVLFDYLGNVKSDKGNNNNNGNNQEVPIDKLPASIVAKLNKYFEGQKPNEIKLEWDKYEITFNEDTPNEIEIEFFKDETFKSVEAEGNDEVIRAIMTDISPKALTYVNTNHAGFRIEEFSKTPPYFVGKYTDGYKVEVEQGRTAFDIYFDKDGNHINTVRD